MKKLFFITSMLLLPQFGMSQTLLSEKKIDYELHKSYHDGSYYLYSAIIRAINPTKDEYKAYCRYIVRDLIKKAGTNKIAVSIYDSKQAFIMFEKSNDNPTPKQYQFIKQHTVALYSGIILSDDVVNNMITYYMDCEDTPLAKYHGVEKIIR